MADAVRVRVLGDFDVAWAGRSVAPGAWRLRKAKTLVKLLAVQQGHQLHRDRILAALWPEAEGDGRNNLNQVVHAARRAIATTGIDGAAALGWREDSLALGIDCVVTTDLEELREEVAGAVDSASLAQLLTDWPGGLLPDDVYEAWAEPHIRALSEWRTQVVMDLAETLLDVDDAKAVVTLLTPIAALEPLHEPAQRALMRALAATGRRPEALQVFERLRTVLRDELGVDPEPATRQVFLDLLTAAPVQAPVPAPRGAGNLPAPVITLIGRERDLVRTGEALRRTRLLTVTGMGGVGKTMLAVELARRCSADYADGAHLVELGALSDGEQVAPHVARVLKLDLPADASALDALVAQLRRRQLLLVLDNCEHLLDACADVVRTLLRGCPDLRVLATSREPLRIEGEVTWRTPSLALPDPESPPPLGELAEIASVRLFVQRATAASPAFGLDEDNASAVSAICYRLDGIPLALELAAACVPTLSPQQIADRLGSALTLLRRGDRGTITRQQTLAATLAWSHDLLVDGERRLLRRLAVFAGSFSLEAVESVCGEQAEDGNVLVSLSRLVDTSMVVAEVLGDAARYRLLDTVSQFATEQLRASGEQAALSARHCDWYLQLAELTQPTSDGRRRTTATQLDIEIDNLRTALAWSLAREPETALRLCVALWRHWLTRGLFGEGRRWLEAALTACPDAGALRARALLALAVFDVRRGDPTRLNELGAAAIAVHRRPDELDGLAQVLHGDAVLGYMRGSWDEAWQRSVEAREAASSYGPERMMVSALHLQGLLLAGRGKLTEAAAALTEVRRDLGRKAEDVVVFPPLTLGFGLEGTPPGGPRVFFEETVLLGRLVADRQADGYVLCNLAEVARLAGDLDGAGALLEDAAARFATLDDCDGEGLALNLLGCVHRVRGSFRDARDVLNRSLQVRRDAGDRRAIGLTQANLGVLAAAQGDLHPGLALIEQAASGFEERQDRAAVAGLALTWVSVQADAGAYEAARNHLLVSLPTFRQIPGNQRAAAWGYAMLSDIEARLGARSEAAVALHEASARFLDLGAGDDEVRVRNTLEHLQSVE